MSHTTKTTRLGGTAGFSIHATHAVVNDAPVYHRRLGISGVKPVYTRVELWRDAENEADVLCSVSLSGAKRKDVVDQVRDCLPANLPPDDAAFLTGLVIQAYLDRAI